MDRHTDSYGETSIPPQLRWRGYTNLFWMWRNRWKMTPLEVKNSWGSHFFTTCGSKFNVKIWTASAFSVEKWPGESLLTLKNDPGSHFSTGSLFNVTPETPFHPAPYINRSRCGGPAALLITFSPRIARIVKNNVKIIGVFSSGAAMAVKCVTYIKGRRIWSDNSWVYRKKWRIRCDETSRKQWLSVVSSKGLLHAKENDVAPFNYNLNHIYKWCR